MNVWQGLGMAQAGADLCAVRSAHSYGYLFLEVDCDFRRENVTLPGGRAGLARLFCPGLFLLGQLPGRRSRLIRDSLLLLQGQVPGNARLEILDGGSVIR